MVDYAHARGVTVEGELGTLGGIEDGVGSGEVHLTDPDQAADFVSRTGIDALAVAIGTSHGAYKFSRKPDGQVLAIDLIEEIHSRIPETHLVMHGSSSVPQDLIDRINAAGGQMQPAFGVPVEEIQQGIRIRGAQDQRRHGRPPRGHRRDPRGARRQARRVRSPLLQPRRTRCDQDGRRRADARSSARPGTPASMSR